MHWNECCAENLQPLPMSLIIIELREQSPRCSIAEGRIISASCILGHVPIPTLAFCFFSAGATLTPI